MIKDRAIEKCPMCGGKVYGVLAIGSHPKSFVQCRNCGWSTDPDVRNIPETPETPETHETQNVPDSVPDAVHSPQHYTGKIECVEYLRDKLSQEEFTGFCMGNVLKYTSRWRKKDGVQDLKKALVYLQWAIENESQTDGDA